jgi:hypothetical protein
MAREPTSTWNEGSMAVDPRSARASSRARPVDLSAVRRASDADLAARFDPAYGPALARLPSGRAVFHGLPFELGAAGSARWVLVDRPLAVDLRGSRPATHVVVAHLCDSWRDEAGRRPPAHPVGHVIAVGEPLARYHLTDATGRTTSQLVRRRFEVNDGILGWGSLAFAAVPHLANVPLDWRGPHPAQPSGRYAPAGLSGVLTILPGAWGPGQTGVSDFVPSPTGGALLWLLSIPVAGEPADGASGADRAPFDARRELVELRLEPLAEGRPGSDVVVAAVTLFDGTADPLARGPRTQVIVGGTDARPTADLGTIIRSLPAGPPLGPPLGHGADGAGGEHPADVVGWGVQGTRAGAAEPPGRLVDLTLAPDAVVELGSWSIAAADLAAGATLREPGGSATLRVLPPARIRVEVGVRDAASGELVPSRVRFVAADGRYLPPVAHRDDVNPGLYEDVGADVLLGGAAYAYVPGAFEIDLPIGGVEVEAVAGFDRRPVRRRLEIDAATRQLSVDLERAIDLRRAGWITADAHVHFLAPSTALLQAAAEDVNLVHLLATQWGDLFTNVTDLPWAGMHDPSGRHAVAVGTENRQNVLGHLGLLGARTPVMPMASAGPPEGRLGGALTALLADWADRCRAAGGLVVAAHFPLPYAEIAADIVSGRIDAVEAQALAPGLDDPTIVEWYRFLNAGERLPIVGGTDKMSAEVPVGAVRTYARVAGDGPVSFDSWAAAVRAGRTFVTSGPVLQLAVEGREPGDVIELPPGGGRLAVRATARAAQPIVTDLELIVNGQVVAARTSGDPATALDLDEPVSVTAGAWIAARARGPYEVRSAFASSMAAHTSPVYVEVVDRPIRPSPTDAAAIAAIIEGARTWVARLATVPDPAERERMAAFFADSLRRLEARRD